MLVRRRRRANRSPEKPAGLFCRDREGKGAVRLGPSTGAQVGRRWQGHPNAVPRPRQCHSNLVGAKRPDGTVMVQWNQYLQMVLLFPPPARARVTPMSVWVAQDGPNVCTGGREASRHGGRDACPVRPGGWRPFGCCGGADPPPPPCAGSKEQKRFR